MKIYVTGPAFTPHGRDYLLTNIRRLREQGFEATGTPDLVATTPEALFDDKQAAMREANALLIILDGTQVDDGAACQMGFFYGLMRQDANKKGILGLLSDERGLRKSAHGYGINFFVLGTLEDRGVVHTSIEDVLQQLKIWETELLESSA